MEDYSKLNWRLGFRCLGPRPTPIKEELAEESLILKVVKGQEEESEKLEVPDDDFKYVPAEIMSNTFPRSGMDIFGHAQCLRALKLIQSGKDPNTYKPPEKFAVDIYNKLKPRICQENVEYQNYVQMKWIPNAYLKEEFPKLVDSGKPHWEGKWEHITSYPQFYRPLSTINLTFDENECNIEFKWLNNILNVGSLAKFSKPSLKVPCILNEHPLPDSINCAKPSYKLPISQDPHVVKILENHQNVNVVISFSGLKCIVDNTDPGRRWMIPVVVKNVSAAGHEPKTVVFIDKPFQKYETFKEDLAYWTCKQLIQMKFCIFEELNFSTPATGSSTTSENENKEHGNIYSNASYRLWNIKKTPAQHHLLKGVHNSKPVELNVVIRSKSQASEKNDTIGVNPVILTPKFERQVHLGANIATKGELVREWAALFFTPFANLYRVRLSMDKTEVVATEKCTMQKVIQDAQSHYQFRPQTGLAYLQKVFEELIQLQPGNYLLQHLPKHGSFVAVMAEAKDTKETAGELFDFHTERGQVFLNDINTKWVSIDTSFILPSFDDLHRMPGMFTPNEKTTKKGKKKTKINTKKITVKI